MGFLPHQFSKPSHMGVSENRGPYSTLNSRVLIIKDPKRRYPFFSDMMVESFGFRS